MGRRPEMRGPAGSAPVRRGASAGVCRAGSAGIREHTYITVRSPEGGHDMSVSRLRHIPGIGVDVVGDAADAAADPEILRLENLDTDLRPPRIALELTHAAVEEDAANSYLPFPGHRVLRAAAAAHVGRIAGRPYDPGTECVVTAGGLN